MPKKYLNNAKIKTVVIKDNKYKIVNIKNGRVFTDNVENVAFISKNKLIKETSFQHVNSEYKDASFNIVLKTGTPKFIKKFKGQIMSLVQGASGNDNYFHWMFDIIPRILLIKKYYSLNNINYFYCHNIKKWQLDTLSIFNINEDKIINSKIHSHVMCDSLLACSHPWYSKGYILEEANNMPKWIIEEVSKIFLNHKKKFTCKKKFFIDRRESKFNHCQIINDDEIKKFLIKNDFEIFKIGNLSIFEQIFLFNNAEMIVGAHGAAFANLMYCKPGAKIIDIIPKFHPNKVDELIAKYKSLNLKYIKTNQIKGVNKSNGDIYLSIDSLKKVFDEFKQSTHDI